LGGTDGDEFYTTDKIVPSVIVRMLLLTEMEATGTFAGLMAEVKMSPQVLVPWMTTGRIVNRYTRQLWIFIAQQCQPAECQS
jgi:hypothetical protein